MNICYFLDEKFISQFLTTTNSIIKNEPSLNIFFYVGYTGDIVYLDKLKSLCKIHFPDYKFTFKHVPSQFPDIHDLCSKYYNIKTCASHIQTPLVYYRLYLDLIWPEISGKVLHLDLDVIVNCKISELFDKLSPDYCFHAVPNQVLGMNINYDFKEGFKKAFDCLNLNNNTYLEQKDFILNKKLTSKTRAFNAGIFAIDLDKLRSLNLKKVFDLCLMINGFNKIFKHNDQSILNVVFANDFQHLENNFNHLMLRAKSINFIQESKIIHYNGANLKPWNKKKQLAYKKNAMIKCMVDFWKKYEIEY